MRAALSAKKADYVVDTGVPLEDTHRQIDAVVLFDAELRHLTRKEPAMVPKTLVRLCVRVMSMVVVTLTIERHHSNHKA